ncbi:MAG: helix-turn-helix domain-containing protein [Actinomycetales bacterium]|nr:helix-turn-helix domain-containing protein [Actinomycetales bacterium]
MAAERKYRSFQEALGTVIRRRRESTMRDGKGLSQQALGEAAGIATGKAAAVAVSRIEKGAVRVSPTRLAAIASQLGTTAAALEDAAHGILDAEARVAAAAAASGEGDFGAKIENFLVGPIAAENRLRRLRIEREVEIRQQDAKRHLDHLAEIQDEFIAKVLDPFVQMGAQVDWAGIDAVSDVLLPRSGADATQDERASQSRRRFEDNLRSLQGKILRDIRKHAIQAPTPVDVLGKAAAASGVGAAVGGAASGLLASWVTASAVASTGTAISTLSGVAATNATLAWLGGGTLAAGGLGVAGGTLVLASIVTLPALIIAGGVFVYQRRQMQAKAQAVSDRLDLAEEALEHSRAILRRTWAWVDEEYVLLSRLTSLGTRQTHVLRRTLATIVDPAGDVTPMPVDAAEQGSIVQLAQVVALASTLMSLPIMRDLHPEADSDAPTVTLERHEWIDLALHESRIRIAELEGHI